MLPEDLCRLIAIDMAASATGSGLNPRLRALLHDKRAEAHAAPQPDARLPGPAHIAGPSFTAAPDTAADAVARGAALAFPGPAAAQRRRA